MSIVPVGKNRHQVNQGGFKHESMLETDAFKTLFKEALAPGSVVDKVEDNPQVPGDLQSAMDQGGLDPERGMPEGADMGGTSNPNQSQDMQFGTPGSQTSGGENREDWAFDPKTGEPLAGLSGEQAYQKAYEIFSPANLTVEVKGELRGGVWQIIISPGKGGRAVSKN